MSILIVYPNGASLAQVYRTACHSFFRFLSGSSHCGRFGSFLYEWYGRTMYLIHLVLYRLLSVSWLAGAQFADGTRIHRDVDANGAYGYPAPPAHSGESAQCKSPLVLFAKASNQLVDILLFLFVLITPPIILYRPCVFVCLASIHPPVHPLAHSPFLSPSPSGRASRSAVARRRTAARRLPHRPRRVARCARGRVSCARRGYVCERGCL